MPSANIRLRRLLDRGFYPVELPPSFRTQRFSAVSHTLTPPANYSGSTTFFDGATFRGPLRTFGVINPVNYILLSQFIADRWTDIASVYRLSSCSGARPKFPSAAAQGRAIETASLAAKRQSQQHLASGFPVILSLDINRFYGSIYTHSIPWAALGKEVAKQMFRARTLSVHWSDRLDTLVRNCNQLQTVGIPIGPDTSRIISELILSRIDTELCATGTGISTSQVYHNIDDYQIGAIEVGAAENAQSRFVRTISRYELRVNDFKTSMQQGLGFAPGYFQRHFDVLRGKTGQTFIEHFFELLYSVTAANPNSNVVGYALKRFAVALARNDQQALLREHLQRLLFAAPHHARWVLPLLLGIYQRVGANAEIRRLVTWGVEVCTRRNDVGSLLWFLYAALFLRINLRATVCNLCLGMSNELVDLILMHGRNEGLFTFAVSDIRTRYLAADFNSPSWLPLYEIERRGWDHSPSFTKLGAADDPGGLYERLRVHDVEFYSTQNYTVEAFDGWNLSQVDFMEEAHALDRDEHYWDFDDDRETYE